ncbi:sensor histidine kinase [Legionella taurinensis]|uniref:histidine kinase n=1 Tax=Legionella taurinensis TaxID=70611 RepID=A0A3A5LD06_9GAMM|nr:HAMP domain-containing sensor histidine kinase [Legionella taurinensis]MDX1838711.1 HAMP domain-containing sensor histidine kinase [Legionella taurinensis]PUT38787.1 histidine kinase [Legionella taurinensis]PUT40215.1 histidine kinase [Legionella taurinensis]PUT42522.1 histidine kinase [Legionella taurinensis]PUT45941.1 histidine kinase [Legionella taurinensis]
MGNFKKAVTYLDHSMQRSLSHAAHQLVAVGILAFAGFPLFYWIWTDWFPQPYENLSLRLVASLLGLGLALTPYWPLRLKPYLPWYWFITILYALPFFYAYFFLMSHASVISAMSLLCSVFLLVLLVDVPTMIILLVLGWGLALLCHYLSAPMVYFGEEHVEMLLVVSFVIIVGSTVNYKTAMLQQQRLDGMAAAAGMIAHELRTPLLGIKSGAVAMARYSPQLVQAYHLASEKGLLNNAIRPNRLQQLAGIHERIVSEIDYANTIIDMLLVKAGRENSLQNCKLEACSIADCLEQALERYPFKSAEERQLISWHGDFNFYGSRLLMQHVLFNLIKNALYAIATVQKGDVVIWAEQGEKCNFLYFRDSAKGMSEQQLARLFNHFYTTTFMGTGLGLSFCKLVMQRFGGDIQCESQEGAYTQFLLTFPKYD